MSQRYVVDASAVLHFVEDGQGAERVERLFTEARRNGTPLLMSVLNWGEVFYYSWQLRGEESAKKTLAGLRVFPSTSSPSILLKPFKRARSRPSTRFLMWIVQGPRWQY